MKKPKIKFSMVNLWVKDIDESIHFYMRLGFFKEDYGDTEEYSFCYMKLTPDSDFVVCLKQSHVIGEYKGKISIEFIADDENGITHTEAYEDLLFYGFKYVNIEPDEMYKGAIFNIGELRDPDGYCLELVDYDEDRYR
jgi:catechol 2,3-dioxygenase-like lactoylglutathione lyase family enzyme